MTLANRFFAVVIVALGFVSACTTADCEDLYREYGAIGAKYRQGPNALPCFTVADCELKDVPVECEANGSRMSGCPTPIHSASAAFYDDDIETLGEELCADPIGCFVGAICEDGTLQCLDGACVYQ